MKSTITLALALLLSCSAAAQAQSDEGPVTIELKDGDVVQGRLLEFGKRIYRLKVGMKVVEVAEGDVKSVRFGKTKAPKLVTPLPLEAPRAEPTIQIKPSALSGPVDLAAWLKSEVPLTLKASKTPLSSIVQQLRSKPGVPLLVQAGAAGTKVSLQLRRLPLRRVFPVLRNLAQVEATPFCGVIYLHRKEEPVPQVPTLAAGDPLTKTLQKRWDLTVDGSQAVSEVFNQLLERAGVTSTQSRRSTSLLTACSVGPVAIKGATLAELITLLSSQAVSVPEAWNKPPERLVWTSRQDVVQLQSSFEAPALALRARVQVGGKEEENLSNVMSELCTRLGVRCDSRGLKRLSGYTVRLPAKVLAGREVIERLIATTKLKLVLEEGIVNLVPTGGPGRLTYGASSPDQAFELRQAAVKAADHAAYARLFTRKSQLGLIHRLMGRVRNRRLRDPESQRLLREILTRHQATALIDEKTLALDDNSEPARLLGRVADPCALYAELATFQSKLGDQPRYPQFRDDPKIRKRGAWASARLSWDSSHEVNSLHFYRFGKRWYLHHARNGIPTRGGEPFMPVSTIERNERKVLRAIRSVLLAQAFFQEQQGVHAGTLKRLVEAKQLAAEEVEGTGYRLSLCVGSKNPKRFWMLVASPVEPGKTGQRHFAVNHLGAPHEADHPIALDPVWCKIPAEARPVGSGPPSWELGEARAIGFCRTVGTAQIMFRLDDKENDGNRDYAANLKELVDTKLLSLEQQERSGYTFELCHGSKEPGYTWMMVASPTKPGLTGKRHFAVNHAGVTYRSDKPIKLDRATCKIPPGLQPVGR